MTDHKCGCHYMSPARCGECKCTYGPSPDLDVQRLHLALSRTLRGAFGSEYLEDELKEVRAIAAMYARLGDAA